MSRSRLSDLEYKHESVNHRDGEYARGEANTNSIESVWAVLKRGVYIICSASNQVAPFVSFLKLKDSARDRRNFSS